MVWINTKNLGDVKNIYRRECEVVETLEDMNEEYIKLQWGIFG